MHPQTLTKMYEQYYKNNINNNTRDFIDNFREKVVKKIRFKINKSLKIKYIIL